MSQGPRSKLPFVLCSILAIAMTTAAAAAESDEVGLVLPEGLWIFDVTVYMPMQTKPSEQRLRSCVTNDPVTADSLMPWAESQGCKVRSVKIKKNRMTWQLRCNQNGQRSRGRGEFEVEGEKGEGHATVSFEMGGRRMSMKTEFAAQRVGACAASDSDESGSEAEAEESPSEDAN